MSKFKFALVALACVLAFLAPSRSYAALIAGSQLNTSGSFNVGPTFLNWNCNAPGGPATCPANPVTGTATGDFGVSSSTGTFAPYNGTFGFETDINNAVQPLNSTFSLPDFITFALNTNETIELTFIPLGTKTASTTCAGLTDCTPQNPALDTPANPTGLSAFNLDQGANGTAAVFGIDGIIHDSTGASASFTGTYTSQFNGNTCGASGTLFCNPQNVLAEFAAAGASGLPVTYSFQGNFTIVPEPMTLSLMGVGLLGLGFLGRRRLQK